MTARPISIAGIAPHHGTGRPGEPVAAALGRLSVQLASLLPAMLFAYMIVIWPLAFGDASIPIEESYLGWMAPFSPPETSSPLKQIAYPLLFVLAVACGLCTRAYLRLPLLRPAMLLLLALIALALASTLWSALPRLSLMRGAVLLMISATAVLAVYAAGSFRTMMRALFVVLAAATLLNLWAVATQAPGPIGHNGIYPQKNFFGWVASVILFFGLYHLTFGGLAHRAAALAMVLAAPVFLVVAQSKTSLGLAVLSPVAALVLVAAARRLRLSPAILVPASLAGAAWVFFVGEAAGLWTFYSVNEAIFGDGTLTGRTGIWTVAMDLIARGPFLGYGYEAVWATGYDGIAYNNALGFPRITPTGHNGYIDIMLYLGWPGLLLLAAFLIAMLAAMGRLARMDARLGWLALTLAIFTLLHNNLESDLLISSNPLTMLLVLFMAVGMRMTADRR